MFTKSFLALFFVFTIGISILGWFVFQEQSTVLIVSRQPLSQIEANYVGRQACVSCHAEQDKLWQGSHHDLSMQEANQQTVLGDFRNVEFSKDGIVTRFFYENGRFLVNTDDPDGELTDFEIKYTFGVAPLQQYLVEVTGGRLQVLSIAWDSRTKEQGGQRWFHLYPNNKIDYKDELHWTKRSQNWNFMCAECHSTNLQKNYDSDSRTYTTDWSEINVACEACHGPASQHVAWAERRPGFENINIRTKGLIVLLNGHRDTKWVIDPASGNAHINTPQGANNEIQVCARCHSRRTQLSGDYRYESLMDTHLPSLLQQTLYHVDGQIKEEETYEYGSFLQSKMYRAGVICSNCHEPHSLKLRAPENEVCLQCHAVNKYDSTTHHFHDMGSAGSYCIDCHMLGKTYMVVDSRRDHSFRIPRPDLSERLGTPNPCVECHANKSNRWAANMLQEWYGHSPKGHQDYAEALYAIRSGTMDAKARLATLLQDKNQPVIARATAIEESSMWLNKGSLPALVDALSDPDPMMRSAGLKGLEPLPLELRWALAHEHLRDPVRGVRAMAVVTLADISVEKMTLGEQAGFLGAVDDYLGMLRFNADDPGAQVSMGNLYAVRGESVQAERAYREALLLDPDWVQGYVNFADFLRQMNRDGEGKALLHEAIARHPKTGILHHSLGLLQVRTKNLAEALVSLKQATELEPEETRFSYVYAVALHSAGYMQEAQSVVQSALMRAPNDSSLNVLKAQLIAED
jgi:predicted CXXCH cytochrome family protein